jgi:hypothetical protein
VQNTQRSGGRGPHSPFGGSGGGGGRAGENREWGGVMSDMRFFRLTI